MLRRWRRVGAWRFQRVRPRRSGRRATSGTSHATAFRDTRRVHRPALCRQSAGGRARCRRSRYGCDAGDRARVQSSRDGVRAAAQAPRAPRAAADFYAGAGTAVCRPSDGRHRGAARRCTSGDTGGRRTGAGRRRSARCVARSERRSDAGARVRFVIPRLPERIGTRSGEREIAAALSLAPADIGFDRSGRRAGRPATPSRSCRSRGLDAMARARPGRASRPAFGADGARAVFLFCRQTAEPGHHFHARMFAPAMGIPEDPATGSAVAAFAGVLVRSAGLPDGDACAGDRAGLRDGASEPDPALR